MQSKVEEYGMYSICTPFDEASVDIIVKMKIDVLKLQAVQHATGHC